MMLPTASVKYGTPFGPAPSTAPQQPEPRSQIEAMLAGYKTPSTTQNIIGYVADALARLGGMPGVYGQQQSEQRQEQSMLQKMLLQSELEDEQWTRRNAMKPVERPAVQQNYEYLKGVNPAAAEQYIQNFGAPPMQAVDITNPDGSVMRQFIPRSGPQVAPQPQPGAVDWSKFKPIGGQTPRASGGFRP